MKKIEFVKFLSDDNSFDEELGGVVPSDWLNVSLITTNHNGIGMDLILAWDRGLNRQLGCPDQGTLYLGHWNDGVV